MTKPVTRDPMYRRRRFDAEIIELCVRWYITYRLSYRDLVAMMAERGIAVSHTTIMRWVLRYVPEYEVRWARFARSPGSSWRMDSGERSWWPILSLPCGGQAWKVSSLISLRRAQHGSGAGLFPGMCRPTRSVLA